VAGVVSLLKRELGLEIAMNELWYLSFDGMAYAAPSKTAAEVVALQINAEVKKWTGTISAHKQDVKEWEQRIDSLAGHQKVLAIQNKKLEEKLSLAKSILYAIAKTYNDDELRGKALDAYNDL